MPTVISVTISSVLLDFPATNDSKSTYQIEYTSTGYPFTKGPSVVVTGDMMYTVRLSYLVPGKRYDIRVLSIVTIGSCLMTMKDILCSMAMVLQKVVMELQKKHIYSMPGQRSISP